MPRYSLEDIQPAYNVVLPNVTITNGRNKAARALNAQLNIKNKNEQAIKQSIAKVPKEKGLEGVYPEFALLSGGKFTGDVMGDVLGNIVGKGLGKTISSLKSLIGRTSKITLQNASKVTDKQWDKAYNAAIDKGDMIEAQRLRDLHFVTKSKTKVINDKGFPIKTYHTVNESYPADFVEFNPNIEGTHSAIYTSSSPIMSGTYTNRIVSEAEKDYYIKQGIENLKDQLARGYIKGSDAKIVEEALKTDKTAREYVLNKAKWLNVRPTPERQKQLYIKLNRPFTLEGRNKTWNDLPVDELPQDIKRALHPTTQGYTTRDIEAAQVATGNYDGGIIKDIHDYGSSRKSVMIDRKAGTVYQINNPTNVKLADAVTYDDAGNIIPLSKRDNFNIKDIRYALLPFGIGLGATKFNNNNSK